MYLEEVIYDYCYSDIECDVGLNDVEVFLMFVLDDVIDGDVLIGVVVWVVLVFLGVYWIL